MPTIENPPKVIVNIYLRRNDSIVIGNRGYSDISLFKNWYNQLSCDNQREYRFMVTRNDVEREFPWISQPLSA